MRTPILILTLALALLLPATMAPAASAEHITYFPCDDNIEPEPPIVTLVCGDIDYVLHHWSLHLLDPFFDCLNAKPILDWSPNHVIGCALA